MRKIVKKMKKVLFLSLGIEMLLMVLALGTVICLPVMASATVVSVAEVSVANPLAVNIYAVGFNNVDTQAGYIMVKYATAPATLVSVFCIDPHYSTTDFTPYEVQSIPEGSGFEAAAWVLNQGYPAASAAAAQVAVWELTWDYQYGRAFNLSDGDFRLNTPNDAAFVASVTTIYNDALAGQGAGFNQSPYVILHSPAILGGVDYQDYIVPNPVPIPASFLLLASGLLGLGLLGYKKKAVPVRREKD